MRAVPVRVVPLGERRLVGWIVGVMGGIATYATTMDLIRWSETYPRYVLIGLSLALWNAGMLLDRPPRPFATRARVVGRTLAVGSSRFPCDGRAAVSVARARRGYAVAISHPSARGCLLEVETEADARALLAALGVAWPGKGRVDVALVPAALRAVRKVAAAIGAAGGLAYFFFVGVLHVHDMKPIGIVGLVGFLATALWFAETFVRRRMTLGEVQARAGVREGSALAQHLDLHMLERVKADDAEPPVEPDARVRVFVRGDETTEAWLGRVDALADATEGYRGAAATRDELYALLDDDRADELARLGAARLLVRKHGAPGAEITKRVPPELAPRVRAVVDDDPDEAASRLDALGPSFRSGDP